MAAYLIADVSVEDLAAYEDYRSRVPAVIEQYGGRYLVRGGDATAAEGDRAPNRMVVLEFTDMVALRRFYDSPEYAPLKAIRQRVARSDLIFVEGV